MLRRTICSLTLLALTALLGPAVFAQSPPPETETQRAHVADLVHQMTLDEKLDYIGGTGFATRGVPRLHIPALEMSDGPFGARSNAGFPSTTYAAGIGLAASWDPALASRVGGSIGRDARARGVHFMLGPGVNIYRSPRNGRNFEYFGEDPFLSAQIAVGYISGMQAEDVSATIKHFLGNNSEFLRHDSDSLIDERTLREIYLPAFEAGVKQAHVGAVMDSYNLINGFHATQNGTYNTDLLRKDWHFPGIVMSDWVATYDGLAAAKGGLDLEMPTGRYMNAASLGPAIKSGQLSEAALDEKIERILGTAARFGWLDRAEPAGEAPPSNDRIQISLETEPKLNAQTDLAVSFDDARNNAVALQSARESAVLLKNTGPLLPLVKSQIKTILVVGPNAYPGVPGGGGSAGVVPFHLVSDLEGITSYLAGSGVAVLYDRGLPELAELARSTEFTTEGGKAGLTVTTFANDSLSGRPATTEILRHVIVSGVTIESIVGDPDKMAAALEGNMGASKTSRRWSGIYTAATTGDYIVALEGAGEGSGNRLSLDGKQLIENWEIVRAFQPAITLHLTAGPHKLLIEDKQEGAFGGHLTLAIVPVDGIVSPRAKLLAEKADVILVAAGFNHASESEGGDRTFTLPFGQDQLIKTMTAANPKTIVAITSGGNIDSSAWLERVPALLETWYAGQAGGTALAEILFGDVNPSGHLPATFERRAEENPTFDTYYPDPGTKKVAYKEGIFVGYRGYEHSHTEPLFPFGFGLSYTKFTFSHPQVARTSSGTQWVMNVTFDVTNSGSRPGAEVAQVYVADRHAKTARPERELKGFERVELAPGETKHVSIELNPRAFAFYDAAAHHWTIAPGQFSIEIGDSVESLPLHEHVDVSGELAGSASL